MEEEEGGGGGGSLMMMVEHGTRKCIICSRFYERKPPLHLRRCREEEGEEEKGEGLICMDLDHQDHDDRHHHHPLPQFRKAFSLFCELLEVPRDHGSLLGRWISGAEEGEEEEEEVELWEEMLEEDDTKGMSRGSSSMQTPPCCSECYEALVEVYVLQEVIERTKASQREHVSNLTASLQWNNNNNNNPQSSGTRRRDHPSSCHHGGDFWTTIRSQLISCLKFRSQAFSSASTEPVDKACSSHKNRDFANNTTAPKVATTRNRNCPSPPPTTSTTSRKRKFRAGPRSAAVAVVLEGERKVESSDKNFIRRSPVCLEEVKLEVELKECRVSVERMDASEIERRRTRSRNSREPNPVPPVYIKQEVMDSEGNLSSAEDDDNSVGSGFVPHSHSPEESDNATDSDSDWNPDLSDSSKRKRSVVQGGAHPPPVLVVHNHFSKHLNAESRKRPRALHFYMLRNKVLLFQNTAIKILPTGLKCLEGHCSLTVAGKDYDALQTIRYHIMDDHDNKDYTTIPRPCPLCQEYFQNGVYLRNHLYSTHNRDLKIICDACWKPFPESDSRSFKYNLKELADHSWTHKSQAERAAFKEEEKQRKLVGGKTYNKRMKKKRKLEKAVMKSDENVTYDEAKAEASVESLPSTSKKEGTKTLSQMSKIDSASSSVIITKAANKRLKQIRKRKAPAEARLSQSSGTTTTTSEKKKKRVEPIKKVKATTELKPTTKKKKIGRPRKIRLGSLAKTKWFIKIDDSRLLHWYTLVKYSGSSFLCQEPGCDATIHGLDYNGFQQLKEHVSTAHGITREYSRIPRQCPICDKSLPNGVNFKKHFQKQHAKLISVICESCWRPFPYPARFSALPHAWTHKSEQEVADATSAGQRQIAEGEVDDIRKKISLLRKKKLSDVQAIIRDPNWKEKYLVQTESSKGAVSKDHTLFYYAREDLLLCRFGFVAKSSSGLTCDEVGCGHLVEGIVDSGAYEKMRAHIKSVHMGDPDYDGKARECPLCGMKFDCGNAFRHHILRFHKPCVCICETCSKPVTVHQTKLPFRHRAHVLSHKSEEELALSLIIDSNKRVPRLLLELLEAERAGTIDHFHDSTRKTLECPECSKQFPHQNDLNSHLKSHVPSHLRTKYECTYCHLQLLSPLALQSHIERRHRPDLLHLKQRECPECGKKFHKNDGEGFRCHLRTHRNELPFVCDQCGKAFRRKGDLTAHLKERHTNDDDDEDKERFQCELCERNYASLKGFQHHRRMVHRNVKR